MPRKPLFGALAIGAVSVLLSTSALAADADSAAVAKKLDMLMSRIEKLESSQQDLQAANKKLNAENATLKSQLSEVQQSAEAASAKADTAVKTAAAAPAPKTGDGMTVPGTDTTIKLGGYVKADAILDVNSGYGNDFAAFAGIPLDGSTAASKDGDFHMHARQTRVNLATTSPTDTGDVKTFLEFDMFGTAGNQNTTNGHQVQLRQAYGEYRGLLAGQTWSTFADTNAFAESLDYVGPVGMPLVRQALVRYTGNLDDSLSYAVALENPSVDFTTGGADTVVDGSKMPDAVAALMGKSEWGQWSLRGLLRNLEVENETARNNDSVFGYGLAASAKVNTWDKDNLVLRAAWGDGIGRYIYEVGQSGGSASYNSTTDELDTQSAFGGYAAYQHHWSDTWRSNFMAGYVNIDNNTDVIGTARNETIWSGHANLLWQPNKKVKMGVEYIHGARELENGTEGDLNRVMASFIYNIN